IERRLTLDGMRFGEAPGNVIKGLLAQAAVPDPDLDALRTKVAALIASGAVFDDAGHHVMPPDPDYDRLLDRAAATLHVRPPRDPAFVRVMFTVDVSGLAKDGNGARQLVRQPPKDGHVFIGISIDDSSPVADTAGALRASIVPNDLGSAMFDDG